MKDKFTVFLYTFIFIILVLFTVTNNKEFSLVENTSFIAGMGYDYNENAKEDKYSANVSVYDYKNKDDTESQSIHAVGNTPLKCKANLQAKSGKIFELGTEKLYVISTRFAKKGISDLINDMINDDQISTQTLVITTDEDPLQLLSYKNSDYNSGADYIKGNLEAYSSYLFYNRAYILFDLYKENKNQGYTSIIPNVNIKDNTPQIVNYSILNKGKLISKIDFNDMNFVFMLRQNSCNGDLSIKVNEKENVYYSCKVNRDVRVIKNKGKYIFNIDLKINGIIEGQNINKVLVFNKYQKERLERIAKSYVQNRLYAIVKKMRNEHKADILNLGSIIVSEYGHNKYAIDNEIIKNSKININVKFKIDKLGLGNYFN